MKRPRIKKVISKVPEQVAILGMAFALDVDRHIERHNVDEPQKAFSEGDERSDELENYRTMAGLLYRAHLLTENDING